MSLATLLSQTADIQRFSQSGEDDRGNQTEGVWVTTQTDVKVRGELMFSEEDTNERTTNSARWRVFLEPTVTINVNDRLLLHGVANEDLPLEVIGIDPEWGASALHHYVAWCTTVANTGWNQPN